MMIGLVAGISDSDRSLPATGGNRGQMARMLLIALLIWVQGLAPFVHAHAGSAHTRGWHLHTGLDAAAQSLSSAPRQALTEATPRTVLQRAPDGPEARAVGVDATLPQGRDAAAEPARPTAPEGAAPSAGPAVLQPVDGPQCEANLISLRVPEALPEDVAGRLPPNRAPPLPAE